MRHNKLISDYNDTDDHWDGSAGQNLQPELYGFKSQFILNDHSYMVNERTEHVQWWKHQTRLWIPVVDEPGPAAELSRNSSSGVFSVLSDVVNMAVLVN